MSIVPQTAIIRQTTTSLEIQPKATYQEWLEVGHTLRRIEGALQWYIGDWLVYGEQHFPTYVQALAELGLSDTQIAAYQKRVWVSAAIPPQSRREELSFGIHESVAKCDWVMRDSLLQWAIDENATVAMVRAERRKRTGETIPAVTTLTLTGNRKTIHDGLQAGRQYRVVATEIDNNGGTS